MRDVKIQWHPGFVAAVDLELRANREHLIYEKEYNLNRKPLQIDLLVLKKEQDILLENEIGKLFRRHNIMEYKSPQDHLDIDTFYKTMAYACLYKAFGKKLDERKAEDITVSLVREAKPAGLFQYFKNHGIPVTNPGPGIYYVLETVPFPTQILVTGELSKENHIWLRALSDRMGQECMKDFLEEIQKISEKYDRELADAVLEVSTRANWKTVEEIRGGENMCQALLELMEPEINQIRKEAAEEAARKAEKAAAEAARKAEKAAAEAAKREAVRTVKNFLKSGKLSAEEIAKYDPRLSLDEIRTIEAELVRA